MYVLVHKSGKIVLKFPLALIAISILKVLTIVWFLTASIISFPTGDDQCIDLHCTRIYVSASFTASIFSFDSEKFELPLYLQLTLLSYGILGFSGPTRGFDSESFKLDDLHSVFSFTYSVCVAFIRFQVRGMELISFKW